MQVFVLGSILALAAAVCMAGREKEEVVVTEESVLGDPGAAEGFVLEWKTDWQEQLLWNTRYTIGTEETVTGFSFRAKKAKWSRPAEEKVRLEIYGSWGGSGILEPGDAIWPEIALAAAERTEPGERHTERLRFADYYEYYPVEFHVTKNNSIYYYDNSDGEEKNFWTDFFRIPVPEEHILEVTVEKDAEGNCIFINCNSSEGGLGVYAVCAFGETDCYFTFACRTADGESTATEGAYGIFYLSDVTAGRKESVEVVCGLEDGVEPVAMCRREDVLYLAAVEDGMFGVRVYRLEGEIPVLQQKAAVCRAEETENVHLTRMLPAQGGLLLVWSDSSFAFVEEKDGQYRLFCRNVFPREEDGPQGRVPVFSRESAVCFDGERLALGAYVSWSDVDVDFAVYGREEMLYYGIYHNSGNLDCYIGAPEGNIQPQGYGGGNARPEEPLKISLSGQEALADE